eukprot:g2030.t1
MLHLMTERQLKMIVTLLASVEGRAKLRTLLSIEIDLRELNDGGDEDCTSFTRMTSVERSLPESGTSLDVKEERKQKENKSSKEFTASSFGEGNPSSNISSNVRGNDVDQPREASWVAKSTKEASVKESNQISAGSPSFSSRHMYDPVHGNDALIESLCGQFPWMKEDVLSVVLNHRVLPSSRRRHRASPPSFAPSVSAKKKMTANARVLSASTAKRASRSPARQPKSTSSVSAPSSSSSSSSSSKAHAAESGDTTVKGTTSETGTTVANNTRAASPSRPASEDAATESTEMNSGDSDRPLALAPRSGAATDVAAGKTTNPKPKLTMLQHAMAALKRIEMRRNKMDLPEIRSDEDDDEDDKDSLEGFRASSLELSANIKDTTAKSDATLDVGFANIISTSQPLCPTNGFVSLAALPIGIDLSKATSSSSVPGGAMPVVVDSDSNRRRQSTRSRRASQASSRRLSLKSTSGRRHSQMSGGVLPASSSKNRGSTITKTRATGERDAVVPTAVTTPVLIVGSGRSSSVVTKRRPRIDAAYKMCLSQDAFLTKLHEIFLTMTGGLNSNAGGGQSDVSCSEETLRDVLQNAFEKQSGYRFRSKKITQQQSRRATMIARCVFKRSDYDCSNSVDFEEFVEFTASMLSALFISLRRTSDDASEVYDGLSCPDGLRQFVRNVYGDDVLLKSHERKYQGKARRKILDHKVRSLIRSIPGIEIKSEIHQLLSWDQCFDTVVSLGSSLSFNMFKILELTSVVEVPWREAKQKAHKASSRLVATSKMLGMA